MSNEISPPTVDELNFWLTLSVPELTRIQRNTRFESAYIATAYNYRLALARVNELREEPLTTDEALDMLRQLGHVTK